MDDHITHPFMMRFSPAQGCILCGRMTNLGIAEQGERFSLEPHCPKHHYAEDYSEVEQAACFRNFILDYYREKDGPVAAPGIVGEILPWKLSEVPAPYVQPSQKRRDVWGCDPAYAWLIYYERGGWTSGRWLYLIFDLDTLEFSLHEGANEYAAK